MRRTFLLLALLAAFSISSIQPAHASAPVIQEKTTSVSGWLSYYIAVFLRAHANGLEDVQFGGTGGTGGMLRGDADDYANGKGDDLGPDTDDKSNRILDGSGMAFPAGHGTGKVRPNN